MSARPEDRLDEIREELRIWQKLAKRDGHGSVDRDFVVDTVAWLIGEVERLRAISGAAPPRESPPDATWCDLERIWCEALVAEGPDVINRVTTRALALRAAAERAGRAAVPPDMEKIKQELESQVPEQRYAAEAYRKAGEKPSAEALNYEVRAAVPDSDLRCEVTGNECGTDTWSVGHPCKCAACRTWLRQRTKPEEVARHIGLNWTAGEPPEPPVAEPDDDDETCQEAKMRLAIYDRENLRAAEEIKALEGLPENEWPSPIDRVWYNTAQREVARLAEETRTLQEALRKYGSHLRGCGFPDCDCGLDALAGVPQEKAP